MGKILQNITPEQAKELAISKGEGLLLVWAQINTYPKLRDNK